ncbi:MAG TPA: DNRLRE domain-containing protein [Bacteroidales bacterium]|nr:DNRLRE domain-containing protein [Bacteroidales bacterium]
MKNLVRNSYLTLILLTVIGFSSCENKMTDNFGKGKAEFSLTMPDEMSKSLSGSSLDSGIISYHIMVSIEDMEGNAVLSDSLIPIYTFGPAFISENVELEKGEFNLTRFLVINTSGAVVYAAPIEGSPLAYLVNKPLPLRFSILPDQVTRIAPEVLLVGDQAPGQFGYASFGMQIIKPLHFWVICVLDPGNPLIMAPIQITTAQLTVYANNGWHYTFILEAAVNHLIIRRGSPGYYFIIEKEGYMPQKYWFSARELMASTRDNPLVLKIPWDSNQWRKFVFQPGPEGGKDAMISNLEPDKNFGDHKYFEATFLSEPVLTVMRSNRSLIWFNLGQLPKSAVIKKVTMQLFYDRPVPFDLSYLHNTDPSTGIVRFGGVLQQIVEPWEEVKVTWNSQPKTIEANQVFISPFVRNVNFIEVDVTSLYVPVQEIAAPNYGMFFKLWPTDRFPGFRFTSSDYPDATMRPKLTVYYTL